MGGSNSVVESQPSKLLVAGSIPVSRSVWIQYGYSMGTAGLVLSALCLVRGGLLVFA